MPRKKRAEGTRAPNGAGSIYYSKTDGKWHGRIIIGTNDDGSDDRRHVKRKTEGEVITALQKLEQERRTGTVRRSGRSQTVKQWLTHWVENIAAASVRRTTMVGYRSSVYNHLIPGIGKHRLDKLQPEHLERLYTRKLESGLKPATVHLAHRTLRVALNEAVRRRHITENPAKVAKAPRVDEDEIVPFSVEEAQRILAAANEVRNGARFVLALTLGFRRGEALGLKWSDLTVNWKHGCDPANACRDNPAKECASRQGSGTLTIRRAVQQHVWKHGCTDENPCGHTYGAHCPKRHGGGTVVADVKSRAGRRKVGLPHPVVEALDRHREQQERERRTARNEWNEDGWMFTNRWGRLVHPTVDYDAWKALLRSAQVRNARLHDARHTAATMLLVLRVPLPAVMKVMGWSDAAIAKRYMHVPDDVVTAIADQVGGLMWPTEGGGSDDEGSDPTGTSALA